MSLKFYTSVAKGLKLKIRKFLGLVPAFVEVTGEKLAGGLFAPPPPPIPPHPETHRRLMKHIGLNTCLADS